MYSQVTTRTSMSLTVIFSFMNSRDFVSIICLSFSQFYEFSYICVAFFPFLPEFAF